MRSAILLLAATVGLATAQVTSSTCLVPTSTIYGGPLATVTQTYTSTYCPACAVVTTTYETAYPTLGSTGVGSATYTCTETCAPDACRTGLPPGFTTTVGVCTACGDSPVTTTLTQPCTACAEATATDVYPTVYQTFGPTGLAAATYSVTATCAASPCPAVAAGSVPPGFTAAVSTCTTCGSTPVTATLTYPVASAAATAGSAGAAAGNAGAAAGNAGAAAGNAGAAAGNAGAAAGGGTGATVTPQAYTGAASSNHAGVYLAAGAAALAAFIRL